MEGSERTGVMVRLLRLWGLYARMDLIWMTRDLRQTLIFAFSDLVLSVGGVAATFLLAERFAGIGRWSKFQVLFMLGYAMAVSGLLAMCFNYNVLAISRRLGRGQLDHTLIQPLPLWMALLTEGFMPCSTSWVLLMGLAIVAWATSRLRLALSLGWVAMLAASLAASSAIVLSCAFIWGSLAFWAPRAAEEISDVGVNLLYQLRSFPLDGVSPALLGGLLTVLPAGFVAWYPCRWLVGLERSPWAAAATPLAAAPMAGLAIWVFGKGLRHYGRTGSQRYSAFGHRS